MTGNTATDGMKKGEFRRRLESYDGTLIIGVAGDSGSGKSTFTQGIRNLLGRDIVSTITLDDYHTEDRETRRKTGHLPLDPAINNLELAAEHFAALRRGEPVLKPCYNHASGKFDPPVVFEPTKIVIIEGLHTFYTEKMRRCLDFTIYVDPDRNVKWDWKIKRDIGKRGYDRSEVMAEILRREPLYKQYIDFQKIFADIVIKIGESRFPGTKEGVYSVKLIQRIVDIPIGSMDMAFDLGALMRKSRRRFTIEYTGDYYYGRPVTVLTLDGELHRHTISNLEEKINYYTGFENRVLMASEDEYINATSFSQLLVAWRFAEVMNNMLMEVERVATGL